MTTLEDNVLIKLAKNTNITNEFPFIKSASKANDCSCNDGGVDMNELKKSIARLSNEAKAKFRALSGFDGIKVIYRTSNGLESVTF